MFPTFQQLLVLPQSLYSTTQCKWSETLIFPHTSQTECDRHDDDCGASVKAKQKSNRSQSMISTILKSSSRLLAHKQVNSFLKIMYYQWASQTSTSTWLRSVDFTSSRLKLNIQDWHILWTVSYRLNLYMFTISPFLSVVEAELFLNCYVWDCK